MTEILAKCITGYRAVNGTVREWQDVHKRERTETVIIWGGLGALKDNKNKIKSIFSSC